MKSDTQRDGDLGMIQDMKIQRRVWKAQRIGWAVMAVIALAVVDGIYAATGSPYISCAG
jgi:hypothetical protein